MSGWTIERRGYSSNPWRIVTEDGLEVHFEKRLAQIHGGEHLIDVCGYATKDEATVALGRIAATLHEKWAALDAQPDDLARDERLIRTAWRMRPVFPDDVPAGGPFIRRVIEATP